MALFGRSDDDLKRRVEELERRVAALERAAFAAGHHVSHTPLPVAVGVPSETLASGNVRNLLIQGKKIEAIKALREETGLGLKQAKNIVERL
jgi:large subunit ribosomal protein L7/L12